MSSAAPLYPKSSAVSIAHFSPINRAVEYVLQPTLSGQMERSATLRFLTPWTLRRSSRTPCLTILFPSLGAIEHVYDQNELAPLFSSNLKTQNSRLKTQDSRLK